MAEFWKKKLDPLRPMEFYNRRTEAGFGWDWSTDPPQRPRYDEYEYFVRVCGFTFRFVSLDELRHVLEYFRQRTHPSSRFMMPHDFRERDRQFGLILGCHHAEYQRWYERIPIKLQANARRERVVRALERALDEFGGDPRGR